MANNENLKKGKATQFKAGEKQAEIARKGGIASGEAKRRKADLRDAVQDILDGVYKVKGQDKTGAEVLAMALFKIAADSKNRSAVAAFNSLAKMVGQDTPEGLSEDDDQVKQFLEAIRGTK